MIRLPDSRGPERRTNSSSRMACGEPPVTREPRKYKERNVSGPQMPSGYKPVLTLVGHQRVVRLQTEVAVDEPGVEAEILQPGLQRRDVVAVHRRTELVIERARAQPVRSFFQRTESRLADDAVDQQSAVLLERAHRVVEFAVEHIHGDVLTGGQIRRPGYRSAPTPPVPPGSR